MSKQKLLDDAREAAHTDAQNRLKIETMDILRDTLKPKWDWKREGYDGENIHEVRENILKRWAKRSDKLASDLLASYKK